jgi:hypothetical protein
MVRDYMCATRQRTQNRVRSRTKRCEKVGDRMKNTDLSVSSAVGKHLPVRGGAAVLRDIYFGLVTCTVVLHALFKVDISRDREISIICARICVYATVVYVVLF